MKSLFLLDPSIHFLNHGSFGACPRAVFEVYQDWQRKLEEQPVLFLGRQMRELDYHARVHLGRFLSTQAENLVFVTNATQGVNIIARSLKLNPGDEILTTDHEYGACNYTWEYICKITGAKYIQQPIGLPVLTPDAIAAEFWQGVTVRTKVIYLSHITSPTALRLPIEIICDRARREGIFTVVDGAHAPGQIPLAMGEIGADWYVGNCHKWMLCPKGAGFLFARPEVQYLVEPLTVSWGYHATPETTSGSQFQDYLGWTGTRDPAASLSVPDAIQFMETYHWEQVRCSCHGLLAETLLKICNFFGMEAPYPLDSGFFIQMGIAPLPRTTDLVNLKAYLYNKHLVEVPLIEWNGQKFIRISVQGYNTEEDLAALCSGLQNYFASRDRVIR